MLVVQVVRRVVEDQTIGLIHVKFWFYGVIGGPDGGPQFIEVELFIYAFQVFPALTSHHPAKHCVLVVQVVRRLVEDEELGAVGVGAAVGHAEHAAPAVQQPRVHLVLQGWAVGQRGGIVTLRAR